MEFEAYRYLALVMVALEVVLIVSTYQRHPKIALAAVVCSASLKGQFVWLGRPFYAWHMAAMLGLVFAELARRRGRSVRAGVGDSMRAGVVGYFVYGFVIAVVMWLLLALEVGTDVDELLPRIVTQLVFQLLLFGMFWFGTRVGRAVDLRTLLRVIVICATAAAWFALLQAVVYARTGVNLFPIIGSDDTIRTAYIRGASFRATSFVGEPKHLGILMATGMIAFLIARLFRIPLGRWSPHAPVVMVVALVLSLSTTGVYLAVSGIVLLAVLFASRLRRSDVVLVGALGVLAAVYFGDLDDRFRSAFEMQAGKFDVEVQDHSVMRALQEDPTLALLGAGYGNIHLHAARYLPAEFPLFHEQGYKANTGLLMVVGDSGVLGLLLLLGAHVALLLGWWRRRSGLLAASRREGLATLALLGMSLWSFLLRYHELHFLLMGFASSRLTVICGARGQHVSRADSPVRIGGASDPVVLLNRAEDRASGRTVVLASGDEVS